MLKNEMIGIPAEKFSAQYAVSDKHMIRVPECVSAGNIAMIKYAVMQVLQRIFSFEAHPVEGQISGVQHEIITFHRTVFHHEFAGKPAELIRFDIAVADKHIAALPKGLDAVQPAPCNTDTIRIPESRAASFTHVTFPDIQPVNMPEGITQIERTAFGHNIRTFLDGAFSICHIKKGEEDKPLDLVYNKEKRTWNAVADGQRWKSTRLNSSHSSVSRMPSSA